VTTERLAKLYRKIPTFKCIEGCGSCCGVVPWAPEEFAVVRDRLPAGTKILEFDDDYLVPMRPDSSVCPFFDHGCTVYDDRPFMCRLFGTARDWRLTCPHGRQPEKILTQRKAEGLRRQYTRALP
jgi:Fe-S-cluster containining protein